MVLLIANIGYFLELWMILIYCECIWKERVCFKKSSWLLFVFNGFLLTGINAGWISGLCVLLNYVIIFVYMYTVYKNGLKATFVKFGISYALAWGTEIIAGFAVFLVTSQFGNEYLKYLLANNLAVVISLGVTGVIRKQIRLYLDKVSYLSIIKALLLAAVPIGMTWIDYLITKKTKIWYDMFLVVLFLVIFIYLQKLWKTKSEIEQKELALQMNDVYGKMYEDVLQDMRRKQHDYKHHLAALDSSRKVAKSYEELVTMQNEYEKALWEDGEYDDIMMLCGEPILAGFLFYKCRTFGQKKVKVDYKICLEKWTDKMLLHEGIEILGILLDNACEEELKNTGERNKISVTVVEEEEIIHIEVKNRISEDANLSEEQLFADGYSTKGENRGLGLARAKQICDKYKIGIHVRIAKHPEPFITFTIFIPR